MTTEAVTRFSIKEIARDNNQGFLYKIYDKRTEVAEAATIKSARRVRDALVLEVLALNAGLDLANADAA